MITEQQKLEVVSSFIQAVAVYTRFISEADQAGAFTEDILLTMSKEMDIPIEGVKTIIKESTEVFDEVKESLTEQAAIIRSLSK